MPHIAKEHTVWDPGTTEAAAPPEVEAETRDTTSVLKRILHKIYPSGFSQEARILAHLSWPLVISQLCQFGLQPVILMFAGRLDKVQFDAVALAGSIISSAVQTTTMGLGTACETLFSQAFGSENKHLLEIYFQRSILIQLLTVFPVIALLVDIEHLLLLLGQDPDVSRLTARYLLIFTPGVLFLFMYIVLRRYMECQGIVIPHLFIGVFGMGINALLQYLLVFYFEMEIDGCVFAQLATYFAMFLLTLLYFLARTIKNRSWEGWSFECLADWGSYMRIAMPGLLMTGLGWWAFELVTFLAGIIGTTEMAAQSICFQIDLVQYMVPYGISSAIAIRVGQNLGCQNKHRAITSYRAGFTILGFTSLLSTIIIATLHNELPKIFTNIPEVVSLVSELLPIVAVYCCFDCIGAVYRAVYRGAGKQKAGAVYSFICIWLIGFSIGIPVMFLTPMRTKGLWWAFAGSLMLLAVWFFISVEFRLDWNGLLNEATSRTTTPQPDEENKALLVDDQIGTYGSMRRDAPGTTETQGPLRWTIFKRVLTLLSMILLVIASLLIRWFVPVPSVEPPLLPSTGSPINTTIYTTASNVNGTHTGMYNY